MDASTKCHSDEFWGTEPVLGCSAAPLTARQVERALGIRVWLEGMLRLREKKVDTNPRQPTGSFQNEIFVIKLGEDTCKIGCLLDSPAS